MVEVLTHNQTFASPQEALAHYGTKGMRWGIRKDKSSGVNEKRVAKYQKNADRAEAQINAIRAKPTPRLKITQRSRDNQAAELDKFRAEQQKNADDIQSGRKLTDSQRKILIGAGVAATVLASYGAYKYVDSGQLQARRDKSEWKKNEDLRGKKSADDIMHDVITPINRGYGDLGTKMNCRRCTFAYEMRRRGYDVSATKSASGTGQTPGGFLNAVTPGAKNKTGRYGMVLQAMREGDRDDGLLAAIKNKTWGEKTIDPDVAPLFSWSKLAPSQKSELIFGALSKEPVGARGELGVGWSMGGGHSMAWENIGGKIHIFDTQSGKHYSSPDSFGAFSAVITEAGYTRLDNKKLNEEFLRRWMRNAD